MNEKKRFSIFALNLLLVTVFLFVMSLTTSNTMTSIDSKVKKNGVEINLENKSKVDYVYGPSATKYFDTEDQANLYVKEMEKEHQEMKEKVEMMGGEYVYEIKLIDKSTNEIIEKTFDTLEDLDIYLEEVKTDMENQNLVINNIQIVPSSEVSYTNYNETFATYELAEANLNKYIEEIESKYGTITNYEIKEEIEETAKEVVESNTDVILESELESYQTNVKEIYQQYLDNAKENEIYELSISEPKKVGEIINEILTPIENGTLTFDSLKEAEEKKAELDASSTDNTIIKTSDITKKTAEITEEYDTFQKEFNTEEEVSNYLESLETEGYTIQSWWTEKVENGNTLTVQTVNKIDESRSSYIIDKSNQYILIKQGSGSVAVWTPTALSSEAQQQFMSSYYQANHVDDSTSEGHISYVEFISGYGSFDLSHIGNNWGTYTFSDNGNTIVMNCDAKKISHLNYGQYQTSLKYVVHVIVSKQVVHEKYEFDYEISKREIVVIDQLEISYTIEKQEKKNVYQVNVEASLPNAYHLEIDYTRPNYEVTHYGVGTITTDIEEENPEFGMGSTSSEPQQMTSYLPPKTGVDKNPSYLPVAVIALGVLLISKKILL